MLKLSLWTALASAVLISCSIFAPVASANVTVTPSVSTSDDAAGAHGNWTLGATYANGSGTTETLRRQIFDFPAGLSYNASAVAAADLCPQATFDTGVCGAASQVGTVKVSATAHLGILSTTITDLAGTVSAISTSGGTTKLGLLFSDAGSGITLRATEQISTISGNIVRLATDDLPKSLTASGQTATFQITKLEQTLSGKLGSGAIFLTNPAACGTWSTFGYAQAWDTNTNANSDPLSSGSNQFVKSAALNVTGTCPADTTPPAAPGVTGPNGTVASTSASISITPAESGGTLQGSLDNAGYAGVSNPVNLTGLGQGNHTYAARQVDAAGNIGSATTIAWTVDTVGPSAPTVNRTNPTATTTNSTTQAISITPAESGGSLQGKLDNDSFAAITNPVNLTGLAGGQHTYQVRQLDAVGNIGAAAQVSWTVDIVAPAAPTLGGLSGTVASTSASVSITPAESGGTLQGSLDNLPYGTVTSPVSLSALSQGKHTYSARQVDAAGNVGAPASITWTVDTIGPDAPGLTGPSGTVTATTASILITPAESGGTLQGKLDNDAFATVAGTVSLSGLGGGQHTYSARQLDAAGNVGSATSISWTVDASVPAAPSIDSGPSGLTKSTGAGFAFSSSESGVTFETNLDGAGFTPATSPATYSGLAEGDHTFAVRAKNAAGTTGPATTRKWTIDTLPPAAPTLSGPSGTVSATAASITITPAESGGTLQGRIDNDPFAAVSNPVSLTGLSGGQHTYEARQIDAAGNTGPAGSISWTIDASVPSAPTIDSGPSGLTNSTSANFTFHSSDSGVTFETNLDGAGFVAATSPASYGGLGQGGHSFAVRAKNSLGTTGPAVTRNWTVDTVAPAAPGLSGPTGTVNAASASITINPAESGGTLQGRLDNDPFGPVTSPVNLTGLGDGPHTFQARQVDAAGNTGSAATISWTVDTSPPQQPVPPVAPAIDSGPSGLTRSTSATFTFSSSESGVTFEVRVDGDQFAAAASPKTYSGLGQGGHTFSVRAKNAAGDVGPAATRTWTVDSVAPAAPTVTRTNPTASPTTSTTQALSIGGAEAGATLQGRLDNGNFANVGATINLSALSTGSHTYQVRQTDAAGNVSAVGQVTWSVSAQTSTGGIGSLLSYLAQIVSRIIHAIWPGI